ncbi:hypothetical protein PM082_002185 [Marasmius tenuissimus]|nr:hypothetical protein PM082_002185 [Marasmius tenuissimus]
MDNSEKSSKRSMKGRSLREAQRRESLGTSRRQMEAEWSRVSRESQETSEGLRAQLDQPQKVLEVEGHVARNPVELLERQL